VTSLIYSITVVVVDIFLDFPISPSFRFTADANSGPKFTIRFLDIQFCYMELNIGARGKQMKTVSVVETSWLRQIHGIATRMDQTRR